MIKRPYAGIDRSERSSWDRWSNDEDDLVRDNFAAWGAKRLMNVLPGRSLAAINTRRWFLLNRASKHRRGIRDSAFEFAPMPPERIARWKAFNQASLAKIERQP